MITAKEYHDKLVAESLAGHFPCGKKSKNGAFRCVYYKTLGSEWCGCGIGCGLPQAQARACELISHATNNGETVETNAEIADICREHLPISLKSMAAIQTYHDSHRSNSPWHHERFVAFLAAVPEFAQFYKTEESAA